MSLIKLLNEKGSALANVIAVSAAVGVGAVMIAQTGKVRSKMDRDVTQNTIIQNTILDMKTYLATESNCQQALNQSPRFSKIGEYEEGFELTNGVSIEGFREMEIDGQPAREITLAVVFKKVISVNADGSEVTKVRPDQVKIQTFMKPDPLNPGSSVETCTSFETSGVDNSLQTLCATVGGVFEATTGECNPNYQGGATGDAFRNQVDQLACRILGGSFNGSTCDGVNITGSIEASHFRLGRIGLGSTEKIGSQTMTCNSGQLASGMERDGHVNCRNISCPKPTGTNASDYFFRDVGGEYFCECSRNRGPGYDCGSRFPSDIGDGLGCEDQDVDDGCGTGEMCTIRKKRAICPRVAGCNETVRDDCGDVCDRGPRRNTWRPSPATVCDGESFVQTNDCGETQDAVGTSTAASCGSGPSDPVDPGCTPNWIPDTFTECVGDFFTQTSQCPAPNDRRTVQGTRECNPDEPADPTPCCVDERDHCISLHGECNSKGSQYCGIACQGEPKTGEAQDGICSSVGKASCVEGVASCQAGDPKVGRTVRGGNVTWSCEGIDGGETVNCSCQGYRIVTPNPALCKTRQPPIECMTLYGRGPCTPPENGECWAEDDSSGRSGGSCRASGGVPGYPTKEYWCE